MATLRIPYKSTCYI